MNMKKLMFLVAFSATIITTAQFNQNAPWMQELADKQSSTVSKSNAQSFTLDEISASFQKYWENRDPNLKGSGYKPYMRWENYWKQLVHSNGKLPSPNEFWDSWKNKKNRTGKTINPVSAWSSIGPFSSGSFSGALPGTGRVNAVAVDPNNQNIWYVGAPAGGLWKSVNAGATWVNLFDDFPQIGISGIAIDPTNSNIVYVATGDDDAADSYSIGVFKSLDGGTSWNETGLNPQNSDVGDLMNEIVIDPSNSNIIWVGTNSGLQKSENGGDTWAIKQSGNISDFKLKPGSPQTIYAVDRSSYYKSTDGGDNFTQITSNLPMTSGRLVLGVSPANPNMVYVLSANTGQNSFAYQGLFKSLDSGQTFTKTTNTFDILESNQAWFDLALEVSPTNADELYIGCLNLWKSTNAGDRFTQVNQWFQNTSSYTHADIHTLKFFNNKLFCGSDGGIYVSEDNANSFTDYTAGIAISQFYRISVAKNDGSKMAGGLQDNSGFVRNNGNWNVYTGGDGMDYEIDPANNNIIYGFIQFGSRLFVSTDSGQSVGVIGAPQDTDGSPFQGNWITPLTVNSDGGVFAGYYAVFKLEGNTWQRKSDAIGDGNIDDLEADPNNPLVLYAAEGRTIYRSDDEGRKFPKLYEFDSNISDIAINSTDGNIIYVTTSNRVGIPQASQQALRGVFKLVMNGDEVTVEDISFNLPDDQAYLSIVHQGRHTDNPIYVGTNLGVYRIDDSLTEWEDYFTSLPNTPVSDLEISLDSGLLTASTYGRGVWQSPIPVQVPDNEVRVVSLTPNEGDVLCNSVMPVVTIENKGANQITEVMVTYNFNNGADSTFNWTGVLEPAQSTEINLPTFTQGLLGTASLSVNVSIANDSYDDNNDITSNFIVNETAAINTIYSFETEGESLIAYNDDTDGSIWERGVPTGNLLNEASSGTQVYGTNLDGNYTDNTKGIILSKCYDLSSILAPKLKFNMAYSLEINYDIVYVQYSIDSGASWQILGNINSQPNWYNSDRTFESSGASEDCQNCPGAQWTGSNTTLTEYAYDFISNAVNGEEDLTNESNVLFRIVFQSDPAVTEEGAVIDDFGVVGFIDDDDDDNDGVLDIADNCPLISNSDQLDTDNDTIGNSCDMDDDNDGIADIDDNCPLFANIDQADFDGDGIGDTCDDDIDDDGVLNTADNCPNTPLDAVVDVTGCEVFSLPITNFKVLSTGESCIASNNGSISIEAEEDFNYNALITGNSISETNAFTTATTFSDLQAGNYMVCITIDEAPDYENCFEITVIEPELLSVSSKVGTLDNDVTLFLSGGKNYTITLNNKTFTTSDKEITIPLENIENTISVRTDKSCQGVHEETIILSNDIIIYPNPIEGGELTIHLGSFKGDAANVSLFSINGTTLFKKLFKVQDSKIRFNIDAISKGIYILNVRTDNTLVTYKIIRK